MESVGATSHSYSLDLHFHIGNEILTLNFAFTEDFRTPLLSFTLKTFKRRRKGSLVTSCHRHSTLTLHCYNFRSSDLET